MTISTHTSSVHSKWRAIAIATLAFWLSGSLVLDFVMMPSMYASGMMTQPDFAIAGRSIFWAFNHIELFCAALVLTAVLVLKQTLSPDETKQGTLPLAALLLAIALIYTYALTPTMSALGANLNLFETTHSVPSLMNSLHGGYWLLELCKLGICGVLLRGYWHTEA